MECPDPAVVGQLPDELAGARPRDIEECGELPALEERMAGDETKCMLRLVRGSAIVVCTTDEGPRGAAPTTDRSIALVAHRCRAAARSGGSTCVRAPEPGARVRPGREP